LLCPSEFKLLSFVCFRLIVSSFPPNSKRELLVLLFPPHDSLLGNR
jgi:hypothetical protein